MDTVPDAEAHADALKARYQRLIWAAIGDSVPVCKVVKVLSPRDTGDDIEVLFLAGPPEDLEPCTAYIEDATGERVLIASGW